MRIYSKGLGGERVRRKNKKKKINADEEEGRMGVVVCNGKKN